MLENIYTTGEYLKNNPTWHSEHSPWKARQILKIITKNKIEPHSICEVGCGVGEILNQLYLIMSDDVLFDGYEISPQAFELSQCKKKDRLRFYLKDFIENDSSFFDVVLAIDVVEHVEDYIGFLRKLRNRGMYKVFHFPLDMSLQKLLRVKPLLRGRYDVGHLHYFTKETALATLRDVGYEIIDCFYTGSTVELPVRSCKQFLMKLPRKLMFKISKDVTVRVFGGYDLLVLTR